MIEKLEIEGYRSFEKFEMHDLKRINLLVGMNNRGKTSVLEALQMVNSVFSPVVVFSSLIRRGEVREIGSDHSLESYSDIRNLFHGFQLDIGSAFTITANMATHSTEFRAEIKKSDKNEEAVSVDQDELDLFDQLQMNVSWVTRNLEQLKAGLTPKNLGKRVYELTHEGLVMPPKMWRSMKHESHHTMYVSTEGSSPEVLVGFLETVLLTDDEVYVLEALRAIEPNIERFVTETIRTPTKMGIQFSDERIPKRRGVRIKVKDQSPRAIGTMGDGIWRLLGLLAGLLNCKNGVFLVDEIDTGLHYTVLQKMWSMVAVVAEKFNVQVFATTHSRDCIDSLASVIACRKESEDVFSVQRINEERTASISYSEDEIITASEHGIEMR